MINLGLARITRLLALSPTFLPQPWKAVHVAGTNGKGSVASYIATLLSRYGRQMVNHDNGISGRPDYDDPELKLRIGRFTSPHLIDRWDCIVIDGKPVDRALFLSAEENVKLRARRVEDELLRQFRETKELVAKGESQLSNTGMDTGQSAAASSLAVQLLQSESDAKPTEFEILTATAFDIFSQLNCHVAVLECGLGGRLDATNAVPASSVAACVITRIGLDHQGLLGDTIEAIAREKAGIIKSGLGIDENAIGNRTPIPVLVDGENSQSVQAAILSEASKVFPDSKQIQWSKDVFERSHESQKRATPCSPTDRSLPEAIWISNPSILNEMQGMTTLTDTLTLPKHQVDNLSLALCLMDILNEGQNLQSHGTYLDFWLDQDFLKGVIEDVHQSYPGRLQVMKSGWTETLDDLHRLEERTVLVDGAHNAQSATVLREFVDDRTAVDNGVIWILAISKGKDVNEILKILIDKKRGDRIIFCGFGAVDGMPWVKPTGRQGLESAVERRELTGQVEDYAENILKALQVAEASPDHALRKQTVVVAGSLYLVSDLFRLIRDGTKAFEQNWVSRKLI